ncbi:MAG TPA: NUDIX hydrolase [Candidatus Ozemobacteraceae bacterium]|nr:NUDIX hydrolase [Candidatus Ozemobacteraceae bacterium]
MSKARPTPAPVQPAFRLCVRCLCLRNGRLLLIRHVSPATGRDFWALPGGLVEKGESLVDAARRELVEETGLQGTPTGIAALQEFPEIGLLEVVIVFSQLRGRARLGYDPEQPPDQQIRVRELRWFPRTALPALEPKALARALASAAKIDHIGLPHHLTCD